MKSVLAFITLTVLIPNISSFKWTTSGRHQQRRQALNNVGIRKPEFDESLTFGLGNIAFSLLPLSPESTGRRKTIFTEIVKDKMWTLDQIQGIINVNVPVRSTIIKLEGGGLWINNPVGPTKECITIVRELEAKHGKVKYILLSTLGVEHKGTASVFSTYFPEASIWLQPGQYSFPFNLPSSFFFPFGRKITTIPLDNKDAPWSADIDHIVLEPLRPRGVGGFGETAFFHKSTKTLLVTDSIVNIESEPPAIIQDDPRALLYHARNDMFEIVKDTPENRRKGWRRMILFGLTFQPAGINITDTFEAIKMLKDAPVEMKVLGEGAIPYDGGLYPWRWVEDDRPSFEALQGGLLVAPILRELILNREPNIVLEWVDKICQWPFQRIIPCHLGNNIKAGPSQFREAFSFLEEPSSQSFPFSLFPRKLPKPLAKDSQLLKDVSVLLTEQGVLKEVAPLVSRERLSPSSHQAAVPPFRTISELHMRHIDFSIFIAILRRLCAG
eukprot:gene11182-23362_t